jgi:hypothetical protein
LATLGHMKERTVGFYEVVVLKDGEARRIPEPMDWDGTLSDLSQAPVAARTFEADSQMVGTIATYDMQDHLLLHRVKDAGEWLSVMNFDTGTLRELEQSAQEGYLDTSVICFLPFGNVVGIMQGGVSAPSHKAAADPPSGDACRGGETQDRLWREPSRGEDHGQQDGCSERASRWARPDSPCSRGSVRGDQCDHDHFCA